MVQITLNTAPVEIQLGENTDVALQAAQGAEVSAGIAGDGATFASDIMQILTVFTRYCATIADGVAAYTDGQLFSSKEGGVAAIYKRTGTAPYYELFATVGFDPEGLYDAIAADVLVGTGLRKAVDDGANTVTLSASDDVPNPDTPAWHLKQAWGDTNAYTVKGAGLAFANNAGSTTAGAVLATATNFPASVPMAARTSSTLAQVAYFADTSVGILPKYGFRLQIGFKLTAVGSSGNYRTFVGLARSTPTNADPSGFTNVIGVGLNAADTKFQFLHNDASGAATKVDTGITPDTSEFYMVDIHRARGSSTTNITLKRWSASDSTDPVQTVVSADYSTDLPADTLMLFPYLFVCNNDEAANCTIGFCFARLWSA